MPARNDRSRASGEIPPPRPSKPEAPTGGSGGGNLADYWCEALARSAGPGGVRRVWLLGRYRAPTSRQALNWLLRQADRLADLLAEAGQEPESAWHPAPGYGAPGAERRHTSPARNGRDPARVFGDWLADEGCQYAQLAALARGERVSVAAVGPDRVFGGQATDVCYSLIARPRRPRLLVASGGGWYRPLAISVAPDGDRWGGGIPATGAVGP